MKIGIFDSGLGGLITTKALVDYLPQYDYLYFGDTANLPYGNKTQEEVYRLTETGVTKLLRENCQLVIVACNTASAEALRRIQQQYLPQHFPDRKVLGVIIPTVEFALNAPSIEHIGVLATTSTISSKAFEREIFKLNPNVKITSQAAPKLAMAIEENNGSFITELLSEYLKPFIESQVDALILGCTHYALIRDHVQRLLPYKVRLISVVDCIGPATQDYLDRHQEITAKLTQNATLKLCVSKETTHFVNLATDLLKTELSTID